MLSPFKLCNDSDNSFHIAHNPDLASKLGHFLTHDGAPLWKVNTHRQRTTHALRFTEQIPLRNLDIVGDIPKNTAEFNQVMTVKETRLMEESPLFLEMIKWIEQSFRAAGVNDVEFGRIFFSKHLAGTSIDKHTDSGAYFSYFDRFHYCITSNENNLFVIRGHDIKMQEGGLYWVNNHVPHWLRNDNTIDRINLIFDARLT